MSNAVDLNLNLLRSEKIQKLLKNYPPKRGDRGRIDPYLAQRYVCKLDLINPKRLRRDRN
jgi:hypothetical protein